jgi:hypothetical protein
MPQLDGTGPVWRRGQGWAGRGLGLCQGQGGWRRGRSAAGSLDEISRLEGLVRDLGQRLAALETTREESPK